MKQQLYRFLLMALLPILVSTGCKKVSSTDLKDDVPYYQVYTATFDKTANSISGAAEFSVRDAGGAKIELSEGALVKMNGLIGTATSTNKTRYIWATTGQPAELKFELLKNSGKTITNTISLSEIPDISFATSTPTVITKTEGAVFTWVGAPLDTNAEYITASITSVASNTSFAVVEVKGTTITFTATDLANCTLGAATLSMRREKRLPLKTTDDTADGSVDIAVTVSKQVMIK